MKTDFNFNAWVKSYEFLKIKDEINGRSYIVQLAPFQMSARDYHRARERPLDLSFMLS